MAKLPFDVKQLLVQKGEKVALGAAGLLTACFLLFNMGTYFAKEGPADKAKKLSALTTEVEQKLQVQATRDDPSLPPPESDGKVGTFKRNLILDPSHFQMAALYESSAPVDLRRKQPDLKLPVEGKAQLVQSQLQSYIFRKGKNDTLEMKVVTGAGGMGIQLGQGDRAELDSIRRRFGSSPGGPTGGPRGGRDARQGFQGNGFQGAPRSQDYLDTAAGVKSEFVDVDKLGEKQDIARLPQTIRPVRQALIVASFPYKEQIAEFKSKLNISEKRVLEEDSWESLLDEDGNVLPDRALEAFRFLGVVVERRTVDHQGRTLDPKKGDNGWEDLDITGNFKPLLLLSNLRTEPDDEKLAKVTFDGLVMPRLKQIVEGQYPQVETELPMLQKSLIDMEKEEKKLNAQSIPFRSLQTSLNEFDIFRPPTRGTDPSSRPPMPTPSPRPMGPGIGLGVGGPPMGQRTSRGETSGQYRGINNVAEDKLILPDYCLIRVIDVTVRPGESYQYRLRVRMANPNFQRDDVVDPNFAVEKELKADPKKMWYTLPDIVSVPTEMHYFAVDQKKLETNYAGAYKDVTPSRDQTVLQIHKYLENAAPTGRDNVPVGEWTVAERVVVGRGEMIDRTLIVEVPLWSEDEDKFRISVTKGNLPTDKSQYGMTLPLHNVLSRPTILVDFSEPSLTYKGAGTGSVTDRPAQEVLIMDPYGRLLAHNVAIDNKDESRKTRLAAWRKRIDEVKNPPVNMGVPGMGDGMKPRNPFSPGKP